MALHRDFPGSPFEILDPAIRWFPADEDLRETAANKLLPPLVSELRKVVKTWRDSGYEGATDTSKALLKFWFQTEHLIPQSDGSADKFEFYFAQREAIETIIYLYDVVQFKDKYDLLRFDSSGAVSANMFAENWRRLVVKMATGSGKTKILALTLVWSYFHKLYEPDSGLARNFLVIAPNIIVLDRIRKDFDGLKVFFEDPILPDNGFLSRDWREDFRLDLHIQDDVHVTNSIGNIFLTNIHRVYESSGHVASFDDVDTTDYFLGKRPSGKTNDSKVDLAAIVREVNELVVLNDEAHHIHDERLAWFKSIEDLHNRLLQKGTELSLQIDVTATPKDRNGNIFVQTVCDYPLVEAIHQNVVKHPVLPDEASRAKLQERQSSKFTEKYADYIDLGYREWKQVYDEQIKAGKKAVLFVMTDDTTNCDDVATYLEATYPDFKNRVLTIHTNRSGEISESTTGKSKDELDKLREESNKIDDLDNPYVAIVSVLMLKEGWDVRNVTTVVGLRSFSSKAKILPEQTLGRGLRRMYRREELDTEYVSIIGTEAFLQFVEEIKNQGVELEHVKMGAGTKPRMPIVIEVDKHDKTKDIEKLDIEIPVLTPRIQREYKNLSELDIKKFNFKPVELRQFSEEEKRQIVFKALEDDDKIHHVTELSLVNPDYRSVIGYFTQTIQSDLRLVSGYDVLYGKVKDFVANQLFGSAVQLEDMNVLRNLSEVLTRRKIIETFKKQINDLTIVDRGEAEISNHIKISKTRPFVVKDQGFLIPRKSLFNRIVGDSHLELEFAAFLEKADDVVAFAKNFFAVQFKIDYRNADGEISNYYPDFLVKTTSNEIYIVETKGNEDLDAAPKRVRLQQWCEDVNAQQKKFIYKELFVNENDFKQYQPKLLADLAARHREET
jgi:type III restriction enzyme